jgi:hypothetical protein
MLIESMSSGEHHECKGFRQGEWTIYRCPKCDYELRDNWRTGELKVHNAKRHVRHSGNYVPNEYASAFENVN